MCEIAQRESLGKCCSATSLPPPNAIEPATSTRDRAAAHRHPDRERSARAVPRLETVISGKFSTGRDDWIRTSDPHTPSVVRYQTALRPEPVEGAPIGGANRCGKVPRNDPCDDASRCGAGTLRGRGGGVDCPCRAMLLGARRDGRSSCLRGVRPNLYVSPTQNDRLLQRCSISSPPLPQPVRRLCG